jgi:hypothetical protein
MRYLRSYLNAEDSNFDGEIYITGEHVTKTRSFILKPFKGNWRDIDQIPVQNVLEDRGGYGIEMCWKIHSEY